MVTILMCHVGLPIKESVSHLMRVHNDRYCPVTCEIPNKHIIISLFDAERANFTANVHSAVKLCYMHDLNCDRKVLTRVQHSDLPSPPLPAP